MNLKNKAISAVKTFAKAFVASLFLWMIGGICVLFVLGSAGLGFVFTGDTKEAITMIQTWSIPMCVGGTLGSLFGIALYEKVRTRNKP